MRKSKLWGCIGSVKALRCHLSALQHPVVPEVSSRGESGQAFPGVGVLPLLGEEGHGLVGGALALAGHFLMQSHALKWTVKRSWTVGGGDELGLYTSTYHVVPSGDDELLLLFVPGPGLLVVVLCQKHQDGNVRFVWVGGSACLWACARHLEMLDLSLLLRQLIFQSLDVRSHRLLLGIQSFNHLQTNVGILK